MSNYFPYHIHDDTSNCNGYYDSCTKYTDYIKMAKKNNMSAISFSNHGGIYDWIKKKQACDKAGIKYVHGVELYLCIDLKDNTRGYHIGLYSKNLKGILELNSLMSLSTSKGTEDDNSDRHYYFNPRISFEELMNTSDNIIITSACLASCLWKLSSKSVLLEEDGENKYNYNIEKRNELLEWMSKNKHRCFLEIQYHNCDHQKEYNKMLWDWSQLYDIPLIAGTDTHSSTKYKSECRKVLQKSNGSFYGEEDEFDLIWKSYDELIECFKIQAALPENIYLEAINNTNKFANMVEDFELDKTFKYPTLYGETADKQWQQNILKYLKEKIDIGEIDKNRLPEYKKQIKEEFNAMNKQGMASFMLFMSELANWCISEGINFSPCRGSVGGSLIAYITNITDVDPLIWGTVFSRFCNADRISLADIDMDFSPKDRAKVYQYIIDRFGNDKVSYILTLGTIKDRGSIDILAKGLDYKDLKQVERIKNEFDRIFTDYTKIIQEEINLEEFEGESTSPDFIDHELYMKTIVNKQKREEINELKLSWDRLREDNKDLFYYFDGIKGTIISKGNHPAGMIGSPITLYDNLGVFYKKGDTNFPVSFCTMKAVDSLNYVKFDILGLKTIGIIQDTYKLLNKKWEKSYQIDWDDMNVWNDMIKSNVGVFQFEGNYAHDLLEKFKPTAINDMSLVNASLRPSGKSYRNRLINHEFNNNPSKEIDSLLKDNYGYLVFQEDTIKFLTDICGFSGSLADTMRRCLDKNTPILMSNGDYKKIQDIKIGDKVQSFNSLNLSEYKTVTNVFKNGLKETYKVSTKHGYDIIGTENHKVLTQRGWVQIKNLKMTDFLMTPKIINSEKDNLKSNNRLSETNMFLIGMLIGDGTIGKNNNIHFTNSEIALIEKFKECINNINKSKNECEFNINMQNGKNVEYIYSIYIQSENYKKQLITFLDKYNLRKEAADKKIPSELMYYPKGGKLLNLLAGLFNTDGGYNTNSGIIEYYSTSKILVQQIKSLLLKYGIYSYIDKKWINDYNYYSYTLYIRQHESLELFKKEIIPYMIGRKKEEFSTIIDNKNNKATKYNFILPNECKEEILKMTKLTKTSLRSIGEKLINSSNYDLSIHKSDFGITDVKAKSIIEHLYCPYTYQLLFADYIPVKVKSIKLIGNREVYDIEVEDNHNYVADGLIVHNCIGKKDVEGLNEQLPKIIDGYCKHSKKPKEKAEGEVKKFVQIISDSSEYQFGKNHSTGYSMNGFRCARFRHYAPLEFTTSYLNWAENKEDINNGVKLAKEYNIKIKDCKFRYSKGEYMCDSKTNSIYKGIGSIKYLNKKCADQLYGLKDNLYNTFIDILKDISEKRIEINARQMNILILLGYFSEFGKTKKLKDTYNIFSNLYGKKQIKKADIGCDKKYNIPVDLVEKHSARITEKTFMDIDMVGLLNDIYKSLEDREINIKDKIKNEIEFLEYPNTVMPDLKEDIFFIIDIKEYKNKRSITRYLNLYSIKTGNEIVYKLSDYKLFAEKPININDIIRIESESKKPKKRKNENGDWVKVEGEFNNSLDNWKVF